MKFILEFITWQLYGIFIKFKRILYKILLKGSSIRSTSSDAPDFDEVTEIPVESSTPYWEKIEEPQFTTISNKEELMVSMETPIKRKTQFSRKAHQTPFALKHLETPIKADDMKRRPSDPSDSIYKLRGKGQI